MATRRKNRSQKSTSSPLGYILFGMVLGIAMAAFVAYYLRDKPSTTSRPTVVAQAQNTPTLVVTPPKNTPVQIVEKPKPATPPQAPQKPVESTKPTNDPIGKLITQINPTQTQSSATEALYLQTDAFKSFEEADSRRAQLLLQGFQNIHIHKTNINQTEFFRVRLGPLSSEIQLKEIQEKLKSLGVSSSITK